MDFIAIYADYMAQFLLRQPSGLAKTHRVGYNFGYPYRILTLIPCNRESRRILRAQSSLVSRNILRKVASSFWPGPHTHAHAPVIRRGRRWRR